MGGQPSGLYHKYYVYSAQHIPKLIFPPQKEKCYKKRMVKFCTHHFVFQDLHIYHFLMYRKGTSIRQAPVFRHLRALRKSPWKFIIWINKL